MITLKIGKCKNLDYKYNVNKKSLEFTKGVMRWKNKNNPDNDDSIFEDMPKCIQNVRSIKFNSGVSLGKVTNISGMFSDLSNLQKIDLSHLDTSKITNMSNMFFNDKSLKHLNLGNHFDTSKVVSMFGMFNSDSSLQSLDLSHFNTANVTNMVLMFCNDSNLQQINLGHFDTSNVTSMENMFSGDTALQSLTLPNSFNTSKVTDMGNIFGDLISLKTLALGRKFNTSNVTPDNFKLDPNLSDSTDTLQTIVIKSSDTVLYGLDDVYKETGKTDKNGKPYTSGAIHNFTSNASSNMGTFTTVANPINHCKIGTYCGLNYKFNLKTHTFTFTSGKLSSNKVYNCNGKYILLGKDFDTTDKPKDISLSDIKSVKFNSNINANSANNLRYMFCNCPNLKSINFEHIFDNNKIASVIGMFDGDDNLVTIKNANGAIDAEFKKHLVELKYEHRTQELDNKHDKLIKTLENNHKDVEL